MNTDAKILALVRDHGFTLPANVTFGYDGEGRVAGLGYIIRDRANGETEVLSLPSDAAHDLCAAHFARESVTHPRDDIAWQFALGPLLVGDSEAAIAALYEAVTGA